MEYLVEFDVTVPDGTPEPEIEERAGAEAAAAAPGASADWQTVLPDGTALGDIRYTLRTDDGVVLFAFISVGGRRAGGVVYETYLVQ